ncbi:MAG TPA: hypothetical protein VHX61_05600 [Rhizomicrobium sp.]|nr:hypothetical protein [Rhizomicrobium sp.]
MIIYPKVGLHPEGSHHNLVFKYFGQEHRCRGDLAHAGLAALLRQFSMEAFASDRNIIISSEELATRDACAFACTLLSCLKQPNITVEFIVACREHFARAESWYKMRLRVANNSEELQLPDQFLDVRAADLCYAPLILKLRQTGFMVRALDYQPATTWTRRFLQYIGFPEEDIPERIGAKQVGPDTKTVVAIMAINRLGLRKQARRSLFRAFAAMPPTPPHSALIFGPEAASRAEALFAEDRAFLHRECNLVLQSPAPDTWMPSLSVNDQEYNEIAKIAKEFGPLGDRILAIVERLVGDHTFRT